ncbi:Spermidine/spermine N(1)-acetyltransferase [Vanrija pseudolonga]|uniref:Spermidine/spermine N(1)-acetyltransferase n=1 Tax=Vanrija pseudolonga TaxID=143232 RepID=A0AAF1BPR1_9TREE|nr:Spermidine/spermine N(1)-acetyltransferase [Vanrija pseudolonga]
MTAPTTTAPHATNGSTAAPQSNLGPSEVSSRAATPPGGGDVLIRAATVGDAPAIAGIGSRSFFQTFVGTCSDADMQAYLDEYFSEGKIAEELRNPHLTFLVASFTEGGQEVVAAFSALRTDTTETCVEHIPAAERIELQRIYADYQYHGRGIAKKLIDATLAKAKELGPKYVWLGVWESNERAKSFYKKIGFTQIGSHDFFVGEERQTDHILGKEL